MIEYRNISFNNNFARQKLETYEWRWDEALGVLVEIVELLLDVESGLAEFEGTSPNHLAANRKTTECFESHFWYLLDF